MYNKMKSVSRTTFGALGMLFLASCGFNASSDKSCTKTLCDGIWMPRSTDNAKEPSNILYGGFRFRTDGTCFNLCPNGQKIWGKWGLGPVHGEFRDITAIMSEDLTNIMGGRTIDLSLSTASNGSIYLAIMNKTTIGDGLMDNWDYTDDNSVAPANPGGNNPQQNAQPIAPVVNTNDIEACKNYLKGMTFISPVSRITITKDFSISVFNTIRNQAGFTGSITVGNTQDNETRILELVSSNGVNTDRLFLRSDGTIQGGSMSFKPGPRQVDSSSTQTANNQNTAQPSKMQGDSGVQTKPLNSGSATAITDKAYFYTNPDLSTKRKAYMVKGEITSYNKVQGDFFYAEFTNPQGIITKGWMLKSDFQMVPEQTD